MNRAMFCILISMVFMMEPAYSQPSCFAFDDNQQVTLRGQIVQSATTEESEGEPPHKYMAIILDNPICFTHNMSEKIASIEVSPVPIKWLGHYVVITGNMDAGDSWGVTVKRITDFINVEQ